MSAKPKNPERKWKARAPDQEKIHGAAVSAAKEIISPAPDWLADFLSDQSFDFVSAAGIDDSWPTRKEMKARLIEIFQLSNLLEARVVRSATAGFLAIHSDGPNVSPDLQKVLNVLRAKVRQALKSPELVDKNGKLRRGRGKPLLPNTQNPRLLCAALIEETVIFFHPEKRRRPPKTRSYSAADKLWHAWFKRNGAGTDSLTGWKDYFAMVDGSDLLPFRTEVRRILSNTAHHRNLLMEENGA
jgi:hypothetical protein